MLPTIVKPDELPAHVPGEIWVDGIGCGWEGIAIRGYHYQPAASLPSITLREHSLIVYRGGTARVRRQFATHVEHVEIEPGDVSVQDGSAVCSWSWDAPIEVLHIYLDPALVARVAATTHGTSGLGTLRNALKLRDATIVTLGELLVGEARAGLPGSQLVARGLAEHLAVQLVRHHFDPDEAALPTGRLDGGRLRRLRDHVLANLDGNLSVAALAGAVGLGMHHFTRLFRATFGTTPHHHVMDIRLERARALLADTRRSVGEVASMTGFADQSHLTRCFKRRYGVSPQRWRTDTLASSPL